MLFLLIFLGKIISVFSRFFKIGSGATWPGEVVLRINPHVFSWFLAKFSKGVIIIAGTNGKTTTSLLIKKVLESDNNCVVHNDSGANLLNGLVSACIINSSWNGSFQADYGVFEVDENTIPGVISNFSAKGGSASDGQFPISHEKPKIIIVLLNLFRDQLDRYGEVDVIAQKWKFALSKLDSGDQYIKGYHTTLILNSDDPQVAYLGNEFKSSVRYFGLSKRRDFINKPEHATDSIFCPRCGHRLSYEGIFYSHLGIWKCKKCALTRPNPEVLNFKTALYGKYNKYNTLAAASIAKSLNIDESQIIKAIAKFRPAFGRQEEFEMDGKKVKIFLAKNPAGFNESLKTVLELGATQLLLVLNDRIPDGRDVSWIWDVDFEMLPDTVSVIVSGDRAYDLTLRLKYTQERQTENGKRKTVLLESDLNTAVKSALEQTPHGETLYVLATYSAMLEVRKILIGKKIL